MGAIVGAIARAQTPAQRGQLQQSFLEVILASGWNVSAAIM